MPHRQPRRAAAGARMTAWRAGVIAAGQGERLRAGGWRGSKAMLPVGGRALIDHALDRFAVASIREVTVLVNEAAIDAAAHLRARASPPAVDLVVRTTSSSHASFALMASRLGVGPTVVTTIDAILPAGAFNGFLQEAAARDGLTLGLTTHVDDENPLWVTLADDGRITALGGHAGSHVTAGLYAWTGSLPAAKSDHDHLREYLGALVAAGHPVFGAALPAVFDVDRPSDVAAAAAALNQWERTA